jgi:hypothetical protein
MASVYRLIDAQGREMAKGDSISYFRGLAADLPPGRYSVEELETDGLGHAHVNRRWGSLMRFDDGTIVVDPETDE